MSQSLSQTFLAITRNDTDLEWLQGALAPLGQVVSAGGGSLDELLALVDVTFASLVFVGLDRDHLVAQSALIEGVLEAKPMLAIVALGDGMDNQLVLNAMRAGARDFVAYGSRSSEVAGLVRRLSKRLPAVTPNTQLGGLTVLYGIQSNADGALLANHMALVVQKSGQQTLLLDLGLPRGDSLALLGLESSFHFGDALRHLRRLDATLIDSAFTSAEAGLPGRPSSGRPSARWANQTGLPGRTATPSTESIPPMERIAGLTRSWSPTEAPPTVTSRSNAPASMAARMEASSSLAGPRWTAVPPLRRTKAARAGAQAS